MNAPPLPGLAPRESESHKGDYGKVLLVGGSRGMTGAISLAGSAAVKSGAGLVTLAVPDRCLETVAQFDRCYMTIGLADDVKGFYELAASRIAKHAASANVLGCGPGMGQSVGAQRIVQALLDEQIDRNLVLDADALNCMALSDSWQQSIGPRMILTPHPGEWSRLTGVASDDRAAQEAVAAEIASSTGATIVLKGASTFVTNGTDAIHNRTGNPGMATGGSGDVLTGVICALLAQGLTPMRAAHLGVHVHGLAGDLAAGSLGQIGMSAVDILTHLPAAFMQTISR